MAATIRITDYSEYGPDRPAGFIIEVRDDRFADGWSLRDWEEWSLPWLAGPFATAELAYRAAVEEFGRPAVEPLR